MTSRRQDELKSVAPDQHTIWLAAQIDEVEALVLDRMQALTLMMERLNSELSQTREQMGRNTSKIVWTVLTASITLLGSVIAWVITIVAAKP